MAEPLALPRRRRAGDAPDPDRLRGRPEPPEARRWSDAIAPRRRRVGRRRVAWRGPPRAGRSAGAARTPQRAPGADRRISVLRRDDGGGDGRRAAGVAGYG